MLNPGLLLKDATVEEIHLELIRRTEYNNFKGERILADLLAHRQDWRAVIFDRLGSVGHALPGGLIKLRDMDQNIYNADTLYILAVDEAAAQRLAALAEPWIADTVNIYSRDAAERALGSSRENLHVVEMWWD